MNIDESKLQKLYTLITDMIGESNGIALADTLELMLAGKAREDDDLHATIHEFRDLLNQFQVDQSDIHALMDHPFAKALYLFFQRFPLPYREEHIHLTGSLSAEFIFPYIKELLDGPAGSSVSEKIEQVYGPGSADIQTVEDVDNLIRLKDGERFERYLLILMLPKLILTTRERHRAAAYHMAQELFYKYNVGKIRLKFTLSRATNNDTEFIPGLETLTPEDVAMGLYEGFNAFREEQPHFEFILSPCFRKEPEFFNADKFANKREDVSAQINTILQLLKKHPCLRPHLCEVDTVGNEKEFYRKVHFNDLRTGFRKLQYEGFKIRSHHGETWRTLRHGIQAVDNAMNIWHIDALEHGLSLGVNPNYYFHSLYQRVCRVNKEGQALVMGSTEYNEITDMLWNANTHVRDKLLSGDVLNDEEITLFTKAKFHTATEVEHYQHDVLNRMIQKKVSLMSLPSSNYKLTSCFEDYKDHPFSWWEKKGLKLGVGTDNYITLNTDFIREMLILLFMDPLGLKITKLLMITTGEIRRPYLSSLYWKMHSKR